MKKLVTGSINKLNTEIKELADSDSNPVENIYSYCHHPDYLSLAYERSYENNGCPGVDGVSFDKVNKNSLIKEIKTELETENYQPSPLKETILDNGYKKRSIFIPTIKDRVVQNAVAQVLHPIFERVFFDCSYGYRPERNYNLAVEDAIEQINDGKHSATKIDIVKCFDNLDRTLLLKNFKKEVADKGIMDLIIKFLEMPFKSTSGSIKYFPKGVPQGGPIAPLLSNIALNSFDEGWYASDFYNKFGGKYIRYADDILILTKYREREILTTASSIAKDLNLEIHPEGEKTCQINLRQGLPLYFLGYDIKITRIKPLKVCIQPQRNKVDAYKEKLSKIWEEIRSDYLTPEDIGLLKSTYINFENNYLNSNNQEPFREVQGHLKSLVSHHHQKTKILNTVFKDAKMM